MVDVVVIGHILNEKIIFPEKEFYPVLGSPVAYSSVCMASLGVDVGIVTKIGKDFPGELLKVFDKTAVNTEGIKKGKNSTRNELVYDFNGNKKVNFLTRADEIKFDDIPAGYLESKIFSVNPMDYEVGIDTIKSIYGLGKITAVDIGGYGGGTSATHPALKNGQEIREICPFFEIMKGSIEDYLHIFGDNMDEVEISGKLLEWGSKISIVTLGSRGSFIKDKDGQEYIPPFPIKNYVDPTGAGDCYMAGFLSSYLEDGDPLKAGYFGTAATSYIVERTGGVVAERMPDRAEVLRRIKILRDQ
ncbi:MAG: carbohydrate kinase family protein [Actinobacteria bacterium]|nr:carbohydrate kinase family protein [Actinomycetota bacterium]